MAAQTQREGASIGVNVTMCRDGADVRPGVNITNYDRLHRFDTSRFGAVVLDESSIIKHHDAKTLGLLLAGFSQTPYRLCATATPAPNDWTELGTHAEFLGVCTRTEMLAEFFVHDGGDTQTWRLKGHARQQFWRWVSSWGALIRKPSDLGYDDAAYSLPPLRVHQHTVETAAESAGMLFPMEAQTLMERRDARRASLAQRVASPVWMDINPSETLQYRSAREHDDERHIAPLQLEVIRRGVELWSNPGDVVLSPFAGIGSEGFVSLQMGRRFVGVELKASYYQQAARNLHSAIKETADLFA